MLFAKPLAELIAELEKLPGVGPKSAQRLAYHLLRVPDHEALRLSNSILDAKAKLQFCTRCQNISEAEECEICRDTRRNRTIVCVVGEPRDIVAIERINDYKAQYHVLHGLISPVDNVFPEQLRIRELLERFHHEPIEEIIVATNPTIEGDSTALYLAKLLKPLGIKVTRIAHGMPVGGELDYADSATLMSAIEFRREM
ncbi:MAG: recombination mediator RecR [Armatimonadota bacterium]